MSILAIDQGTSGTKAVVVDDDGSVRGVCERPVRPDFRAGGVVEQDPEALFETVIETGRTAVAESGVRIDAVAFANQGETVLAWDPATGTPHTPAIVWQDRRAESVCAQRSEHATSIAERTGLVLDPYFSAPKMTWLRENMSREGVVTTLDSWLLHRLSGEFVTDVSTASRSLLTALDTPTEWDGDLLDVFDLGDERTPRIVDCDEVVGSTSSFTPDAVPLAGLVVDQQSALLAQHCLEPGEAKCTFGTGAFLLVNSGREAVRSHGGLSTSVAWRVDGETSYCLDGQVYTAASAIRWLRDLGVIDDVTHLDAVAADDSDGVLCVPAFAGLAAPWWRADATASLTGMTLATGKGQLVRAVLQGIAAQVAELADVAADDTGHRISTLRVDGGLTQSTALMQSVADILQVEVEVYPSAHATPLGAVALARAALDPALGLKDAVVQWKPSKRYTPQWSADRAHTFRAAWVGAVEANLTPGGTP